MTPKKKNWNRIIFRGNLIVLTLWVVTALLLYFQLPEIIPIHTDWKGKIDGYGSKTTVFVLVAIAILQFAFLYDLAQKPNSPLLNVPQGLKDNPPLARLFVFTLQSWSIVLYISIWIEMAVLPEKGLAIVPISLIVLGLMLLYLVLFLVFYKKIGHVLRNYLK